MRLITEPLPGTGGLIKTVPEDFVVEELPAYAPTGEGAHTFLFVEKRSLTTDEAVGRLAAALGVPAREAGTAGLKDRQAVTRQWISLPGVDPDRVRGLALDGVRVLEAARHGHKLRTGHSRGNRFTIVVRGTTDGVTRARAIVDRLATSGMPNWFGAQRFGARDDNARLGRALLDGRRAGGASPRDRSRRRLLVSAYQSELFNRYLERRIADELYARVLDGDVLKKRDTGGLFIATSAELDDAQARLDAGAIAITGPMFGHKMMAPPEGTPSRAHEDALLVEEGIDAAAFVALGHLAEGTRRPLVVPVGDARVDAGDAPGAIVITFTLPPGAYATVLLAEVTKLGGNDSGPGDV
jgi:tRNA pseudouridine13 synthase